MVKKSALNKIVGPVILGIYTVWTAFTQQEKRDLPNRVILTGMYFLLLCALSGVVTAYWRPGLPPPPYCGIDHNCCTNRQDDCSHIILDTLCYCDEFCERHTHDDCCPDYQSVCKNEEPKELLTPCKHGGNIYQLGETRMEDCNKW
ncbi:unnamed protein product [Euphydryas editha]|uniref:SMB domain-containing protein n=1 Tax=Euphydryas editha TaxID=104508 RepID=A0AAU9UIQ3_EUPED|nr:unnamed protein product [Euphydryas editha]